MNTNPKTRMYTVRVPSERGGFATSPWARIWITEDGCFTSISDHGNYGYWWGDIGPDDDFRQFLIDCDPGYYITTKLSHGVTEFDGAATVQLIRERILQSRRCGSLTRNEAAYEWDLVHPKPTGPSWRCGTRGHHSEMETQSDGERWYAATRLPDASELFAYHPPSRLLMFMKKIWPEFVKLLQAELDSERKKTGAKTVERCIDCRRQLPDGHTDGYCPARDEAY